MLEDIEMSLTFTSRLVCEVDYSTEMERVLSYTYNNNSNIFSTS